MAPAVLPPLDTAVTFQKYVVFADRVPGVYEDVVSPVATAGGGLAVPNATLNVVPAAPADQLSTGAVPTPVAPVDGVGEVGAAGGPPAVPAVVNDQTDDVAIIVGAKGVALVRDTIFQKYVVPPCSGA